MAFIVLGLEGGGWERVRATPREIKTNKQKKRSDCCGLDNTKVCQGSNLTFAGDKMSRRLPC